MDFLARPALPVVYVCTGTVAQLTEDQLRWFAEGLASSREWRVLWSVGESMQSLLPVKSDNDLLIVNWVPQAAVLSHPGCVAAVLHCGWGSTCDAIASGKPVCAIPFFGDQPINARMLHRMGMCKIVGAGDGALKKSSMVLSGKVTPEEFRGDLRSVVTEPSFAKAAAFWMERSRAWGGGTSYAAKLIEALACPGPCHFLGRAARTRDGSLGGILRSDSKSSLAAQEMTARVIAFIEDPASLTFSQNGSLGDDSDDEGGTETSRGEQLELLLVQCAALLGPRNVITEWLLRLCTYRDFLRFCAGGQALMAYIDVSDLRDFVHMAACAHKALLCHGVIFGLFSPLLENDLHRPPSLAHGLLAVSAALALQLDDVANAEEPTPCTAALGTEFECVGTPSKVLLEQMVTAARLAAAFAC